MRWKSIVMAILLAGTLAGQPRHAVAQTADDVGTVDAFDSEKFWDYAACGAGIVIAVGTTGWFVAAIACGRALQTHWTT